MSDESEMFYEGFGNRKAVLGDKHVEKSWAAADDFNRPVQRLVTKYCWGEVWGDESLSFKTRSMINIAMLTAMNQQHELAVHVKGALTNGVSRSEIQGVLLQTLVYCGAPAALAAFRTASHAISEWEAAQGNDATEVS
ncbi:gamma carboxymuconolactone decarboxylase [Halomonas sp. MCCC 1A11036]|uniref:Gamma carboxymuconolactone decarboxylase n=1 Tax=Billgrantia zhangzhouensis TaxID=2733481 RepID=A0ABS9AI84_9GAMM|nr:carboxymuconolactone decarboxylase family protein [Halomonas zhangzhouensis]MCE8021470.1 gamma carboxymuconolactone decarboxylase [Halomonas zhangzhouensis]